MFHFGLRNEFDGSAGSPGVLEISPPINGFRSLVLNRCPAQQPRDTLVEFNFVGIKLIVFGVLKLPLLDLRPCWRGETHEGNRETECVEET